VPIKNSSRGTPIAIGKGMDIADQKMQDNTPGDRMYKKSIAFLTTMLYKR